MSRSNLWRSPWTYRLLILILLVALAISDNNSDEKTRPESKNHITVSTKTSTATIEIKSDSDGYDDLIILISLLKEIDLNMRDGTIQGDEGALIDFLSWLEYHDLFSNLYFDSQRKAIVWPEVAKMAAEDSYSHALLYNGQTHLRGRINGHVIAFMSDVTLESGASISGHALAIGGKITQNPEAVLKGETVEFMSKRFLSSIFSIISGLHSFQHQLPTLFSLVCALAALLTIALVNYVMGHLVPALRHLDPQGLRHRPVRTLLLSGLFLFDSLLLHLLLGVSVVGLFLVPLLDIALTLFTLWSLSSVLKSLGHWAPWLRRKSDTAIIFMVGSGFALLCLALPKLGYSLLALAFLLAMGNLSLLLAQALRRK